MTRPSSLDDHARPWPISVAPAKFAFDLCKGNDHSDGATRS